MRENRKVGLGLIAVALSFGVTAVAGAEPEGGTFSADVDSAMADIEKMLSAEAAPAVVSEPVAPLEVAQSESSEAEGGALPAEEEPVAVTVEPAAAPLAEAEPAVTEALAPEASPVPVEEAVAAAQEQIAAELTVTPAEEKVAQEAAEEFIGFEPVERVVAVIEPEMEGGSDTLALPVAAEVVPSDRITVQLDKAGLEETINLFSQLSGVNIIIPRLDREGTVTVNLNDVEWKPALQSVLDSYNLELYQKVPSVEIYTIRDKSPDAPEPLELKTFRLSYATVDEVEELVKSVLSEGSKVSKFPSRNMITVRSTAAAIEEIDELVAVVDVPRQQVFIEAKFLELSDSASESIGLDWAVLDSYGVTAGTLSSSYSSTDTKVTGTSADDVSTPEEYTTASGLDALWGSGNESQSVVSKVATSVLSADDFRLALSALKDLSGTRVVSNPKIIVANEETASIHIGDKVPNVKGTTTTSGDDTVVTTYELDDTEPYFTDGIKVNVTPTVNTENSISVKIEPTLDRLDSTPFTADDGTEFYGKTTKTINTVFSLQSGQTAAIGGLTEVTDVDVDRSVPVLGSIPLLGRLFSYSSTSKEQVETIIFVTVGLANPVEMKLETGLPEDAALVRRYRLMNATDRAVVREELRLLEVREAERTKRQIDSLRAAELKRLSKQQKDEPVVEEVTESAAEVDAGFVQ